MIGSPHFQSYTTNFNRLALIEMIDNLYTQGRRAGTRASLVANPLTNIPYGERSQDHEPGTPDLDEGLPAVLLSATG